MDLSVVLPSYNEADNLKKILPEINSQVKKMKIDYEVLIIDTTEKMDDTEEICKLNNAIYVTRECGNNYGDAIRTGIKKSKGKYILIMDSDGSHEPKSICELYNKIKEGYDLVIGSRYCKGGKTDNNFILKMMSWVLNVTYKFIFKLKVNDCSNSFRLYKSEKLKNIHLVCNNFDIVEEILIKLFNYYKNFLVAEVPIHFKKRDKGVSKRDLVKFIFSYVDTIKRLKKLTKC